MKYIIDNINNYNENDLKNIYQKINKKKQEKINKYANDIDKKRSIIGEYLLMELLKNENIDYNKLEFIYNENGKPYTNEIYFNISHKDEYVTACISNKEIGIDIETIKDINMNTLNMFASNNEKKQIKNNIDFYILYTLKEAYIKMKGLSLSNIKNIEFDITNLSCSDNNVDIKVIKENDYIISIIEKK